MTFAEAETVFLDEHGLLQSDPDHSDDEDRFILLGASTHRLLLVCHCYREEDAIRPIFGQTSQQKRAAYLSRKEFPMRKHYDFSKAIKNPYAKLLKKQVTLRLDQKVLAYFKELGVEKELPWQTLINMYLRECAATKKKPLIEWHPETK